MEKFTAYAGIIVGTLFLAAALFVQGGAPGERILIAFFGGYLLYHGIKMRDGVRDRQAKQQHP